MLKRYEDDGSPRSDLKLVDYCARNCLFRFDRALRGVLDNFPNAWAEWAMRPLVFPLGGWRRPASDEAGKEIVRAALQPGDFRDRLTREIYVSDDPSDRVGLLEYTLLKVVANEEADKKLERAIRKGEVRRFHDHDWIADAERKGVLTAEEAVALAEQRELVERVIAVDDFAAGAVSLRKAETPAPAALHSRSGHMAAE